MTSLDDLSQPEQYEAAITVLADVTDALMDTAKRLGNPDIAVASRCPGWTRGHVLTHVARNADALRNLLTWARTGNETPMYPSSEQRDADIAAGAGRSAAAHESDVEASAERFLDDLLALDPEHLGAQVRTGTGAVLVIHDLPYQRAREVVFHHVDLDAGYGFADAPQALVRRALVETGERLTRQGAGPLVLSASDTGQRVVVGETADPTDEVTGTAADLLTWASGRGDGSGLSGPAAGLPTLPAWG